MAAPPNAFKRGLLNGPPQLGLWSSLGAPYVTELIAGIGFDWILIDMEHSPNDLGEVLGQLQIIAGHGVSAVVRPPSNDTVTIKRLLDIGAQSLLVPFVQTAEEAARAVAAVRYPPKGVRGVSAITRATRFGGVKDYAVTCEAEICLVVQIETAEALANLEAIASVDGVDAVFIGPADLAASLGHLGAPGHPDVRRAVEDAFLRLRSCGKPYGALTADRELAAQWLGLGAAFMAVGLDSGLLATASRALHDHFRGLPMFLPASG